MTERSNRICCSGTGYATGKMCIRDRYEDYSSHPTKATASALITLTLESNWDRLSSMEGYAKYIALRPRAERLGEHGLFGDDDDVDLSRVMAVSYTHLV